MPVAAAAALGAAVTKWQLESAVLTGLIAGHSQALSGAASAFSETEQRNAANVQSVGSQASGAIAADL